jgi:cysteine desulfurase / selenocysteine lyase
VYNLYRDFPLLQNTSCIYFDNAATTQKPQQVIDALAQWYTLYNAPIGKSVYPLAESATALFEKVRQQTGAFFGASKEEIIFTSGTTESINFVARSWALETIKPGDRIVLSHLEHHANLLPWQMVAQLVGAELVYIPITNEGELEYGLLDQLITKQTKLVAISHVSNLLGTIVDLDGIISRAHQVGAKVFVDAAQSAPHQQIDVSRMGADFLTISPHKMMGPTGLGILYSRSDVQQEMVPYKLGGGMVYEVDFQSVSFAKPPRCFEAGTAPAAEVFSFGAALDYYNDHIDFKLLALHEAALTKRMIDGLLLIEGVTIYGPVRNLSTTGHMVTFSMRQHHAHDIAAYLGAEGICVRSGHFCAQPLAKRLGIQAAVRASFYLYNTPEQIDVFLEKILYLSSLQSIF